MAHTDRATNPRWSWLVILASLIAVAALFLAIERGGIDSDGASGTGNETDSPIQDYLRFAGAVGDRPIQESGADHDYIVEGLRKLAGALGTLNLGRPDLQVDLRVAAEHLLLNPVSEATTEVVRDALISAADAIEPEHANGEGNLRRLAESIGPDRPLLDQQAAIREFFRESARAMQVRSSTTRQETRTGHGAVATFVKRTSRRSRRPRSRASESRRSTSSYQHRVDPDVPIEDVAGAVKDLIDPQRSAADRAAPATARAATLESGLQ